MTSIEERFSAALHKTARGWRHAIDRRLKELDLGQASWMAIAMIAKSPQPPSQSELAHQLGVENPTSVTSLVALLVCLAPTTIGALLSAIGRDLVDGYVTERAARDVYGVADPAALRADAKDE